MSTHTAHFGIGLPRLHRAPTLPQASRPARTAAPALPWLARLAAWAERQPQHHRLGSWTRL
jgi:hypothetical protein